MGIRKKAVGSLACMLLFGGVQLAFAAQSADPLLYNNLHVKSASWSLAQEEIFMSRLDRLQGTKHVHSKVLRFIAPNKSQYYFGVVEGVTVEGVPVRIFVANHEVFHSEQQLNAYIQNRSDWELVESVLGVYQGPITVSFTN